MGIFLESMDLTFNQGDAMAPGTFYGTRRKYIHSVGAHGKFRFNDYQELSN